VPNARENYEPRAPQAHAVGAACRKASMGFIDIVVGVLIAVPIVVTFWLLASFVGDLADRARQRNSRRER
jgi:hypothetical protein